MQNLNWLTLAIFSAAFAALMPIFGKIGMKDVNPTAATVLRALASALVLALFGTAINVWPKLRGVSPLPLAMILLSGAAGAASWVFYYNALKKADVSLVSPVDKLSLPMAVLLAAFMFGERPTAVNWVGVVLIAAGTYLSVLRG